MDVIIKSGLYFGMGIIFQAFLLIFYHLIYSFNFKKLGWCIFVSLIGFIPGRSELPDYDLVVHMVLSFLIFSFVYSFAFKEEILPTISEQTLLSLNIVTIFVFFVYFNRGIILSNIFSIVLFLATLMTLYLSFSKFEPPFIIKVCLYVWYLVMIVLITISQFSYGILSIFFEEQLLWGVSNTELFLTGMAFLYLMTNLIYILELIPIPGKHQTFEERMEQFRLHVKLLSERYSNYQLTIIGASLIIIIESSVLLANYFYKFLPPYLLINCLLLTIPFISLVKLIA